MAQISEALWVRKQRLYVDTGHDHNADHPPQGCACSAAPNKQRFPFSQVEWNTQDGSSVIEMIHF